MLYGMRADACTSPCRVSRGQYISLVTLTALFRSALCSHRIMPLWSCDRHSLHIAPLDSTRLLHDERTT